jgi:hypothetical protein
MVPNFLYLLDKIALNYRKNSRLTGACITYCYETGVLNVHTFSAEPLIKHDQANVFVTVSHSLPSVWQVRLVVGS